MSEEDGMMRFRSNIVEAPSADRGGELEETNAEKSVRKARERARRENSQSTKVTIGSENRTKRDSRPSKSSGPASRRWPF